MTVNTEREESLEELLEKFEQFMENRSLPEYAARGGEFQKFLAYRPDLHQENVQFLVSTPIDSEPTSRFL